MKAKYTIAVAIFAVMLAGASISLAQDDAYFTGQGYSTALNLDITIAASRVVGGTVRGRTVAQNNFFGNVEEVVPPSGLIDYWCIKSSVDGMPGIDWIWFVKDLGLSGDTISYATGNGLTCANVGAPVNPFNSVDTGDFTGEIVPNTCATDLADCQSDLATANVALATCNANLAQCTSDLSNCTDACELPALPDNYEAQYSGKGYFLNDNTAIKISAKRKLTLPNDTIVGKVLGQMGTDKWKSTVFELEAPSGFNLFWCVSGTITDYVNNPGMVGQNVVVQIRDSGQKGCETISMKYGVGFNCSNTSPDFAIPTYGGDFKGGKVLCSFNQCC